MAYTNLVPTMTSNTTPSGVASGSVGLAGSPWNLFDKSNSTYIITEDGNSAWWQYQFTSAQIVTAYSLKAFSTNGYEMPVAFNLLASNTGAFSGEEVTLDSQTAQTAWGTGEERTYDFTNTTAYLYYRVDVVTDSGYDYLTVDEIRFLEGTSGAVVIESNLTGSAVIVATVGSLKIFPSESILGGSAVLTTTATASIATTTTFTFVQSIQLTEVQSSFKFVQSIEQPTTATIIQRVNI